MEEKNSEMEFVCNRMEEYVAKTKSDNIALLERLILLAGSVKEIEKCNNDLRKYIGIKPAPPPKPQPPKREATFASSSGPSLPPKRPVPIEHRPPTQMAVSHTKSTLGGVMKRKSNPQLLSQKSVSQTHSGEPQNPGFNSSRVQIPNAQRPLLQASSTQGLRPTIMSFLRPPILSSGGNQPSMLVHQLKQGQQVKMTPNTNSSDIVNSLNVISASQINNNSLVRPTNVTQHVISGQKPGSITVLRAGSGGGKIIVSKTTSNNNSHVSLPRSIENQLQTSTPTSVISLQSQSLQSPSGLVHSVVKTSSPGAPIFVRHVSLASSGSHAPTTVVPVARGSSTPADSTVKRGAGEAFKVFAKCIGPSINQLYQVQHGKPIDQKAMAGELMNRWNRLSDPEKKAYMIS